MIRLKQQHFLSAVFAVMTNIYNNVWLILPYFPFLIPFFMSVILAKSIKAFCF